MKHLRFFLILLLWPFLANAQSVHQSGNVTARHIACWTTSGVIQDCGTPANPFANTLGIVNGNLGSFAINSGPTNNPYTAFDLGVNASGPAIRNTAIGGATHVPTNVFVNGSLVGGWNDLGYVTNILGGGVQCVQVNNVGLLQGAGAPCGSGGGGGGVASFNGRTGAVTLAAGDVGAAIADAGAANSFFSALSVGGAFTKTQPSFSNISGVATPAQLPLATTVAFGAVKPDGSTITISGGVITAVGGGSGVASFNSRTGAVTLIGSDVGGAIADAGSTNTWFSALSSGGVFTKTQPQFSNIGGTAVPGQLPTATSVALGIVRPDNTTITISAGVLTAVGGGGGSVTTSGSPATGNLTKFSGATVITNADLTGDVTTSGTTAATIAGGAVTAAKMAAGAAATNLGSAGGALTGTYPNPTLGSGVVANSNLANMPSNTVKGNPTGSPAAPQDMTVASSICFSGTSIGTCTPDRTVAAGAITFSSSDLGGQVNNSNGTSPTATIPTNTVMGASQGVILVNQSVSAATITITNSQTVNGLPLSTKLHSGGFYSYAGNGVSADAFGFPGFDTITTNAVPKFSDASGATTASTIVDNGGVTVGSPTGGAQGVGTINATNLFVNGVAVAAGGNVSTSGSITTHGIGIWQSGTGLGSSAAMTDGQLVVGQTGADPLPKTITGDWTLSAAGAATLKTSGALAGSWTTTTQSTKDNSTKIATTAYVDAPTQLTVGSGSSLTTTAPRQYVVCTTTCTVTPPVPAAGYEFCIMNDDNVSTVITMAALGSSARYENTARTAYGTAGTGTFISGGAVGDKVCLLGRDSTHYLTVSFNGTWTAN